MNQPLVSVVMSVYNAEKYLVEAIESILQQTYKNFEFIIIDDGSTDRSSDIIKHYALHDHRVKIISRENWGLVDSLNEGIQKAKGKYIARMDADDISFSARLEKQVAFMEKNLDIGLSGTAVIMFGENRKENIWRCSITDKAIKTELLFFSPFAHPAIIMRREVIVLHRLQYHHFLHAEDFELWTRMAKIIKMANLSEVLLKYRVVEESISRQANKNMEERYKIHKKIFGTYLKTLGIMNTEQENRLHFNIALNSRMRKHEIDFKELKIYFNKLLLVNKESKVFDPFYLKKLLGKKWLINIYYRKNIKRIFSKYFLYGILGLLDKRSI